MNPASPPLPPQLQPPKKKGLSTGCIVAIVVVVCVLLVIGGIAALAAIGVVGGQRVIQRARDLQAKATTRGLEIATKSFQTEYDALPLSQSDVGLDTNAVESEGKIMNVLFGDDATTNPRQIRFFDAPPAKMGKNGAEKGTDGNWEILDPWGNHYHFLLDVDGNGKIPDPEGLHGDLNTSVLIYSAGADGDYSTWKDNVRSWQ